MPSKQNHKRQWLHNREFIATIDDAFTDWMMTAMFYAALHAAETLLSHDRVETIGGHTGRNQTLKTTNRYRAIWKEYRPLFDASRAYRYTCVQNEWMSSDEVKTRLVGYLYRLERSVRKLALLDDDLQPIWG